MSEIVQPVTKVFLSHYSVFRFTDSRRSFTLSWIDEVGETILLYSNVLSTFTEVMEIPVLGKWESEREGRRVP